MFKICKNDKFTLFQKYQIEYLYKYFQNGLLFSLDAYNFPGEPAK